jgi:GNAT superfamily N-acetyltransferase
MNIRELKPSDLQALLALYQFLHATDEPLPDTPVIEAVWSEALASPRCRYLGGFEGDELVSSCTIMVIPNLTRGCRPYGVIENVVTHAAHRKKGWGKALLARALDFAWTQQCYKVMLMTGRKDEETLRFYTSAGFDMHGKQAFIAKSAA